MLQNFVVSPSPYFLGYKVDSNVSKRPQGDWEIITGMATITTAFKINRDYNCTVSRLVRGILQLLTPLNYTLPLAL